MLLHVTDAVGAKVSQAIKPEVPPEPLVRDEGLRKTDSVREWDKGKKPLVYGIAAVYLCYFCYHELILR